MKYRTIHIDDEAQTLSIFRQIVENIPKINLLRSFTSLKEASAFLASNRVDLIYLDVIIPGEDSMQFASSLKYSNTSIIFLTNHSHFAFQAFEACALLYVIKPFTTEDITKTIRDFESHYEKLNKFQQDQINEFYNSYVFMNKIPQNIFIKTLKKTIMIKLKDILYLRSGEGPYTHFNLKDTTEIVSSKTLKIYDEILSEHPDFIRIHRSVIINKNYISSINNNNSHDSYITMTNGSLHKISERKKQIILEKIKT
jgi:two-component system LytT family response regulator